MIGKDGVWREEGESVFFPGGCPFLLCAEIGAHSHPICQDCGAVNHGNLTCPTCRQNMRSRGLRSGLLDAIEAAGIPVTPPACIEIIEDFMRTTKMTITINTREK